MSYASYEGYKALYGEALPESGYNRLSWEADREMDFYTTGVDGVKKTENSLSNGRGRRGSGPALRVCFGTPDGPD